MASCGFPTPGWPLGSERGALLDQAGHGTRRVGMAATFALLAFVGLLTGCTTTRRYGSPPRTDRLEVLRPAVSSPADVRLALGEPRGHGMARLAPDFTPRPIWSYEYTETEGKRIGLKILLVFFEEDRYDGYLWFSAAALLEKKE